MNTIFLTTIKHVRRSPYQALAAIITMFLTFLLSGFFLLFSVASAWTLDFFESKPQITVFFSDKSTESDAKSLQGALESTRKVSSIKYISKDDALAIYREQNKNDPLLLEMVTADILPASLEVSALEPQFLAELEPFISKAAGVEEVVYQKDVVDALLKWTFALRLGGGFLALILAVDAVLIILTVIAMKIALRREEIEILKLVGATTWFIRMPYILEGIFYGVLGALGAWAILGGLLVWLRPTLVGFLGIIPDLNRILSYNGSYDFLATQLAFGGILLLGGIFLGSVGSLLALVRYLKI